MSQFEFVQITYAIILGFGIASLLENVGDQLRMRAVASVDPLQMGGSLLMLLAMLSWLWGSWNFRSAEWSFAGFLGLAVVACVLALAAHVFKVDTDADIRSQYFRNARVTYPLLALTPLFAASFASQMGQDPLWARRLPFALLLGSLGFVTKAWFHYAVLIAAVLLAMTLVFTGQATLGGSD